MNHKRSASLTLPLDTYQEKTLSSPERPTREHARVRTLTLVCLPGGGNKGVSMKIQEVSRIELGESIPWCFHEYGVGRITRIEYSGIYRCYRVTCNCEKTYQLSITGKYVEAK